MPPQETYGFMDGSKFTQQGVQVAAPSVATLQAGVPTEMLQKNSLSFPPTTPPQDPSGFVSGISSTTDQAIKEAQALQQQTETPAMSAATQERSGLKDTLSSLYDKAFGKSAALKQEEQNLGLPEADKRLADLNVQIAEKSAAFDKQFAKAELNPEATTNFVAGQQAAIRRQQATEIGALASVQAALQGNIKLARDRAKTSVDLQFEPIEQQITKTERFLDLNRETLSEEEKKQSQVMELTLQKQKETLATQKEARAFALENAIESPYYQIGKTVYRTSDGKPYSSEKEFFADGGDRTFSNVAIVNGSAQKEKDMVIKLANEYPDAGIQINDSLGTAQSKLEKSKLYKDQVRGPVGGGGGTVTERLLTDQQQIIKNASAALRAEAQGSKDGKSNPETYRRFKEDFIGAGGTDTDFKSALSIEQYISRNNQQGDLAQSDAKTTETKPQYLNDQFFKSAFGLKDKQVKQYMERVNALRNAGQTDDEILKSFQ